MFHPDAPARRESPFFVLIADDSSEDRFFPNHAIGQHAPHFHVVGEVETGRQLIEYLSGKDQYADRGIYPLPDLLLMDWQARIHKGRRGERGLSPQPDISPQNRRTTWTAYVQPRVAGLGHDSYKNW